MSDVSISERVLSLVSGLDDNRMKDISVTFIAKELNIDRSHLSREFRSQRNVTLHSFIIQEKMRRAAHLLDSSREMKVSNISHQMGFCSSIHFSRVFKKHFGIVPSKYRKCRRQCSD
jgi:transcriptional regulator GlxA family with amidase domain